MLLPPEGLAERCLKSYLVRAEGQSFDHDRHLQKPGDGARPCLYSAPTRPKLESGALPVQGLGLLSPYSPTLE